VVRRTEPRRTGRGSLIENAADEAGKASLEENRCGCFGIELARTGWFEGRFFQPGESARRPTVGDMTLPARAFRAHGRGPDRVGRPLGPSDPSRAS
jgi:hypothetical protein